MGADGERAERKRAVAVPAPYWGNHCLICGAEVDGDAKDVYGVDITAPNGSVVRGVKIHVGCLGRVSHMPAAVG